MGLPCIVCAHEALNRVQELAEDQFLCTQRQLPHEQIKMLHSILKSSNSCLT